jgi:methylthioribose-1-phosphate isomerase
VTDSPRDAFSPIRWRDDHLELLDQTVLPHRETWLECPTPEIVADAIRRLAVRGAPAIGVSAAFGLVVGVTGVGEDELEARFDATWELLAGTRPTAVNLRWALDRGREVFERHRAKGTRATRAALLDWAQRVHAADIASNRRMGEFGAALFEAGNRVLTHCNAGALATGGYGTALGVIQSSWAAGRLAMVWVDETRPLLQGARLTAWELARAGIPYRLVTDSSVGSLMSRGLVDRVVVGADRIAANGDTANKIGTYTVAVLAHRHGVPFYVAAPLSTIDRASASGDDIPIEERAATEVTHVFGVDVAPDGAAAANFAFDVTPAELIAAIITDVGVLEPPFGPAIDKAFASTGD